MNSPLKFFMQITVFAIALFVFTGAKSLEKSDVKEQTPWGEEIFSFPEIAEKEYRITSYGAKPDEGFNNQTAIQKTIDQCNSDGGGMVIIPAGNWETSFLNLKSNVNLHLENGAELFFSDSIDLYKVPTFTRWEGIECMNYHPLIYIKDGHDVAITGEGKINGNGRKWWSFKRPQRQTLDKLYTQVLENVPPEERNCLAYENGSYLRPSLIQFVNCKNVWVEGVEVTSGPMWTVHFIYCENVIAQNLKVITRGVNNDGIVPDATKKMLIDNCFFSTGDDCIVIKSGLNEDGWRVGKPSERIVIKQCNTAHGHGGVVVGSEMSGGVQNIYAYNCNFSNTQRGLRIKSMKGRGGFVKNLWMENIKMDSISAEAIKINMKYTASSIRPRNDVAPVFSNFNFKNITSTYSRACVNIIGLDDQRIDGLYFDGLNMHGETGINISNTENSSFKLIDLDIKMNTPINLEGCSNMDFNEILIKSNSSTLFNLTGENRGVTVTGSNSSDYKNPVNEEGASSITFK